MKPLTYVGANVEPGSGTASGSMLAAGLLDIVFIGVYNLLELAGVISKPIIQ